MSLLKTVLIIGVVGVGLWFGYEYFIKPKAKDFLKQTYFPAIIELANRNDKKLTASECKDAQAFIDYIPEAVSKGLITQEDANKYADLLHKKCKGTTKANTGRINNKCRLTPSDCVRMYGEDSQLIYNDNGVCSCISENEINRKMARALINERRLLGISS